MFHAVRVDLMCWTLLCLATGLEKGHEIRVWQQATRKATRLVSKYLLVFLEPLSVFQDKTLGEELWYLDVFCLKSRFVSISINTQRKQIATRTAVNAINLQGKMCKGNLLHKLPKVVE